MSTEQQKHEFLQFPVGHFRDPNYDNGRCWQVMGHALYCGALPDADIHRTATDPTEKHKQEAREIPRSELTERLEDALHVARDDGMARLSADTLAAALSTLASRDTEIREVLEGLSFLAGGKVRCWCAIPTTVPSKHSSACLAARRLWDRLQS